MKVTSDTRAGSGVSGVATCVLAVTLAVGVTTSVVACSPASHDETEAAGATPSPRIRDAAVAESRAVSERIAELRSRFVVAPRVERDVRGRDPLVSPEPRSVIGAAAATRFDRTDDAHLRAVLPEGAKRAVFRNAAVLLPRRANDPVELEDETTHVAVSFALRGANRAPVEVADGLALYRGALDGADVVHRVHAEGTEDYVALEERPAHESLEYEVDISRVAGVRLVSNTLEFLDEGGKPRLRMSPPYVVGADGARSAARIAVSECAVDTDTSAPWGRPLTRRKADRCVVSVTWQDVTYPALVDPSWNATGSMAEQRYGHTATLLGSGVVLVTGGHNYETGFLASAELFDGTSSFAATGSMAGGRFIHTATLLGSGKVLVAGGRRDTLYLQTAELYDGSTFAVTGLMNVPRERHTATLLSSGKVLLVGGFGYGGVQSSAELFDGTSSFATTGPLVTARAYHTATLLPSGKVLVAGGEASVPISSAELFDGTSNFAATGSMTLTRSGHSATLLGSGKVLIAGGVGSSTYRSSAELFDGTSSFAATGSMLTPRGYHTATRLGSGEVLIAGGVSPTMLLSTELFDGTSAFVQSGPLVQARHVHTETLLAPGKVLLTGGNSGEPLSSAELFGFVANGGTCSVAGECTSRLCVDGICCASTCGTCQKCQAGTGTCGSVTSADDTDTCTGTQTCDGIGECKLKPGQPSTVPTTCASGSASDGFCCDDACNGGCDVCAEALGASADGACTPLTSGDPGRPACGSGFACNGTAKKCPSACVTDADCLSAYRCTSGGACRLRDGQPSTVPASCASGFASDGYCCNQACTGGCDVCAAALGASVNGACTALSSGDVGRPPCGNGFACNGTTKACPTACATDADCLGPYACTPSGACKLRTGEACSSASACASGFCANGFCCNTACTGGCDVCDATAGTCTAVAFGSPGTAPSCHPYLCGGAASCPASCSSDSNCASGYYCSANSTCVQQKVQGTTCNDSTNADCKVGGCRVCVGGAGRCADGFCCNSACGGACDACNGGVRGWAGATNGSCAMAPVGFAGEPDCGSFACTGSSPTCSASSCSSDTQCGVNYFCAANGTCEPRKSVAAVCNAQAGADCNQTGCRVCATGNCTDGYCCGSACTGACQNCSANPGTCSAVVDADDTTQCTGAMTCDANAACKRKTGQTCTSASDCSSGSCADGYCCDKACAGGCDVCNVTPGTCTTVAGGNSGANPSCAPSLCSGTSPNCPGGCSSDVDCASTHHCSSSGQCLQRKEVGTVCSSVAGADCLEAGCRVCSTNFCVDGYCCNSACSGPCDACAVSFGATANGTCAPAPAGASGTPACSPYLCSGGGASCPGACVSDGDCVATHYCAFDATCKPRKAAVAQCNVAAGADCLQADCRVCGTGHCSDGVCCDAACGGGCDACKQSLGATADGSCTVRSAGAAGDGCGAFLCDGVSPSCPSAGSCTSDVDCSSGNYCDSTGVCRLRLDKGQACTLSRECKSVDSNPFGYCVDGFCCDLLCDNGCSACAAALKASGQSDGTCGPAKAGTDPHNSCDESLQTSCGNTGSCNGEGGCQRWPLNTQCGASYCSLSTVTGKICNGNGACVDVASHPCSPYLCQNDACTSPCASSAQCEVDYYCVAGTCVKKQVNGRPCATGEECATGFCVDGVCCDSPCGGQCEACGLSGSVGLCTAVTGQPVSPRADCEGTPPCKGRCNGGNRVTCTFPDQATSCGSASCARDVLSQDPRCDGAGACSPARTQSCVPYACSSAACKDTCATDRDCAAGAQCDGSGRCTVVTNTCKDAFTVISPSQQETSCLPYRCAAGVCQQQCAATADCAPGYDCSAGRCVLTVTGTGGGGSGGAPPSGSGGAGQTGAGGQVDAGGNAGGQDAGAESPPQAAHDEGGCGCRTVQGRGSLHDGLLVALCGLVLARRRHLSRRGDGTGATRTERAQAT